MHRYGTYKLIQGMPGGENMVAFTRILHRTTPDLLMSEVLSMAKKLAGSACRQHVPHPMHSPYLS